METTPIPSVAALRADHEVLLSMAGDILAIVIEDDSKKMSAAISALQLAVAAHLDAEERELLPGYAKDAPQDAANILEDHAAIRRVLAGLDLETDLHLIRANAMHAFLSTLQAHAARENAGMYRWASAGPSCTQHTLEVRAHQGDRS